VVAIERNAAHLHGFAESDDRSLVAGRAPLGYLKLRARRFRAARRLGVGAVLIVGALLRIAAACGDLWLDEIWSIDIARRAGSWAAVFAVHHDNNHLLNTIWLLFAGGSSHALWLRLPSLIAGTASIALAGIFVGRRSRAGGLAAMILTAASYLLVLFGSEARGYGLAVYFTLLAPAIVRASLQRWNGAPCLLTV